MKLSMMSYTLARQVKEQNKFDIVAMCKLAQELKIEAVDMVTLYGRKASEVKRMLDDHGLKVACHTFMSDINLPTAAERAPGVDVFKTGIENAVALGTGKVMFVTPGKQGIPRDISRRNYIHGLLEAAVLARTANIIMTIENFPGLTSPFVISSDILEAIREVPGLKLTFDNGNAFTGGENPAISFTRCAEHVAHAHFKDWSEQEPGTGVESMKGKWYKPALIGEGVVDQAACLKAMAQAGYKGYVNIEYEGDKYPADIAVRKAVSYLRQLMPGI